MRNPGARAGKRKRCPVTESVAPTLEAAETLFARPSQPVRELTFPDHGAPLEAAGRDGLPQSGSLCIRGGNE